MGKRMPCWYDSGALLYANMKDHYEMESAGVVDTSSWKVIKHPMKIRKAFECDHGFVFYCKKQFRGTPLGNVPNVKHLKKYTTASKNQGPKGKPITTASHFDFF